MSEPRASALVSRIVPCEALETGTVSAMYALFARYFMDTDRVVFEQDLSEKDHVVLLCSGDELVGFSTVQARTERVGGDQVAVLFSGDTIIERGHWGREQLERCWLKIAIEARERLGCPLYWLLISSGYRTYRYLPAFFLEFWPRYDRPTPPSMQAMLDTLSYRRFGAAYRDGIIRLGCGHLRGDVSPVDVRRLRNPHIAYFVKANPGHIHGDELACITRVDSSNLTRAGLSVLRSVQA